MVLQLNSNGLMENGYLRPNYAALNEALGIYRSCMRGFIVDGMRSFILIGTEYIKNCDVEDIVIESLEDAKLNGRIKEIRRALNVPDADIKSIIDISDFPYLVEQNWEDIFGGLLYYDNTFRCQLQLIRLIRNDDAHPPEKDLESEQTRTYLSVIADVLGKIGTSHAKQDVERIRDELFVDDTRKLDMANERINTVNSENTKLWDSLKTEQRKNQKMEKKLKKATAKATSCEERLKTESKRLKKAESEKKDYKRRYENASKTLEAKITAEKSLKAQLKEAKHAPLAPASDLNPEPAPNTETSTAEPSKKGNPIKQLAREMDTSPKKIKKALKALCRNKSSKKVKRLSGVKVAHLKKSPSYAKAWKRYQTKHA